MNLQNTLIFLTGGSRGLGKNAALQLAANGADVILTYRTRAEEAQAVVAEIETMGRKALALQLDTAEVATFAQFVSTLRNVLATHWGRENVDFLVNNAGIDSHSLISQTTEAQFDALLNVHFKGVYFLTQQLLPMIADGGGIINISTGLTRFAIPGYGAYAAMKSAIETFTLYLAKELGARGIRANVLAPGAIETDFTAPAFNYNPKIKEVLAAQTALGRVGLPGDIGGIIAFLCAREAAWINAQRIEASGGMFL